jgi:predicted amino acid-binding ACT domain protein
MTGRTAQKLVISVLVADRVGILRDICTAAKDLDAEIHAISQTVVEGYFTVILTASFADPRSPEAVRAAILSRFSRDEASVAVREFTAPQAARGPGGDRYIVTITGENAGGLLHRITGVLAQRAINIEDWYVAAEGRRVTHVGEITVPPLLDIKQVQDEFRQAFAGLSLRCAIQHENIFRVTNEVGAVRPLLLGAGRLHA